MLQKGQKLYSILYHQCPRCHDHDMFKSSALDIKNFTATYQSCPNCHEVYEKEPGFFYGAMYISYGLQVAELITFSIIFYLLAPGVGLTNRLIITILFAILLLPFVFRLSRAIWINLFIHYSPEEIKH